MPLEVNRIITEEMVDPNGDGYFGVWPKAILGLRDGVVAWYDYYNTRRPSEEERDQEEVDQLMEYRKFRGLDNWPEAWSVEFGVAYQKAVEKWSRIEDEAALGIWFLRGFTKETREVTR